MKNRLPTYFLQPVQRAKRITATPGGYYRPCAVTCSVPEGVIPLDHILNHVMYQVHSSMIEQLKQEVKECADSSEHTPPIDVNVYDFDGILVTEAHVAEAMRLIYAKSVNTVAGKALAFRSSDVHILQSSMGLWLYLPYWRINSRISQSTAYLLPCARTLATELYQRVIEAHGPVPHLLYKYAQVRSGAGYTGIEETVHLVERMKPACSASRCVLSVLITFS